ncbi:hypothetical protein EVAR_3371_1 [Eumeta japonica]|uniref:Uncharacterized protein n=1 Tax=Eumeta variegata TaxID=151549 RepID=A0A4C1SS76_EUMVA|nr:hypothetical protein EVAR_3371_1 [Eumeta japonica]
MKSIKKPDKWDKNQQPRVQYKFADKSGRVATRRPPGPASPRAALRDARRHALYFAKCSTQPPLNNLFIYMLRCKKHGFVRTRKIFYARPAGIKMAFRMLQNVVHFYSARDLFADALVDDFSAVQSRARMAQFCWLFTLF